MKHKGAEGIFGRLPRWGWLGVLLVGLPPLLLLVYAGTQTLPGLVNLRLADRQGQLLGAARLMETRLEAARSDVLLLSTLADVVALASSPAPTPRERQRVAELFSRVADARPAYVQLRFIDDGGQEVVRVDRDDGRVWVLPEAQLQFKGRRYYFTDAMDYAPGEIYVSRLDLNVEHGELQRPLLPVIRLATPVVDVQGGKRGLVVVNMHGNQVLDAVADLDRDMDPGAVWLMDQKGVFLYHPDPDYAFAAQRGREVSLARDYPDLARWLHHPGTDTRMGRQDSLAVAYTTVQPDPHYDKQTWRLIEILSAADLVTELHETLKPLYSVAFAVVLLVASGGWLLGRRR